MVGSDHNIVSIKVLLSGHFVPNRKMRKPPKRREFDIQLFMSDEKCSHRVIVRVVSTLNQLIQPRNTSGMVEFFTTIIVDAVEKGVPPRHVATAGMDGVNLPKPWPHSK